VLRTCSGWKRPVRLLAVAILAAFLCLAAGAAAGNVKGNSGNEKASPAATGKGSDTGKGAGGTSTSAKEPARPAHDTPTTDALLTTTSGTVKKGNDHGKGAGGGVSGLPNVSGLPPVTNAAPGAVGSTTLVLYDTSGDYGWLGELYATGTGNLVSHFGPWKAEPVSQYQAGQISQYTATIYIGSTYDEPLPATFLDDVYNATRPVIWIYDNIWQLTNRYPATFQPKYGWMWSQFDLGAVSQVQYKGVNLTRDSADNGAGIMNYSTVDTTKATPVALAVHDADGSKFPWALRSGTLTYIGENPFVYTGETDRVIAFEDMLYDALNPSAPTRHRALVRLEDINPSYDPAQLKAAADYLFSQGIRFGFGLSPVYTDPLGAFNDGTPETIRLRDAKPVAGMIQYLQDHGGTLVMHGYTHQYTNVPNPYNAVTGDDFEFYRDTENADHTLNYVGPVPEDSTQWALDRINASFDELKRAHISAPTIFEFPHYAASVTDYQAVAQQFSVRWERALYFGGVLTGSAPDYSHIIGQGFPYLVRDVYGTTVLPEDMGSYAPEQFYIFKPHTVADMLAAADAESAVRDGFAAFYYHPFEGVAALSQVVDGLRARGWTFASPTDVAANG
jgi:uncharacterized protein YdaL